MTGCMGDPALLSDARQADGHRRISTYRLSER